MRNIKITILVEADDQVVFKDEFEGFGAYESMLEKTYKVENAIKQVAEEDTAELEEDASTDGEHEDVKEPEEAPLTPEEVEGSDTRSFED